MERCPFVRQRRCQTLAILRRSFKFQYRPTLLAGVHRIVIGVHLQVVIAAQHHAHCGAVTSRPLRLDRSRRGCRRRGGHRPSPGLRRAVGAGAPRRGCLLKMCRPLIPRPHCDRPSPRGPGRPDLRIVRPEGRSDDRRRHGDLRIRPNQSGPRQPHPSRFTLRCRDRVTHISTDGTASSYYSAGGRWRGAPHPSGSSAITERVPARRGPNCLGRRRRRRCSAGTQAARRRGRRPRVRRCMAA